MSCAMDLAYPLCVQHTSILSAIIWVSSTSFTCYEAGYNKGCQMPSPSANSDLFPVFLGSENLTSSGLKREAVLPDGSSQTVPMHLGIAFVNSSTDFLKLSAPGGSLIGRNGSIEVETLVVAAPGVTLENLVIGNLTFQKGINFKGLTLKNVVLGATARIVPSAAQHTVDLDGAVIENITGGAVALFRPTGTIHCAGTFTRCFLLNKNDPGKEVGIVIATDGATVVNMSVLTRTFGPEYMVDYFAFSREEALIQATNLANALVWPTVVVLLSVVLAHGSPKKMGTPDGPNA